MVLTLDQQALKDSVRGGVVLLLADLARQDHDHPYLSLDLLLIVPQGMRDASEKAT